MLKLFRTRTTNAPAAPRAANVQAMGPRQALPVIQARVSPARGQPQVKEEEWAAF